MNKESEPAVEAMRKAARAVARLRKRVDPGHVPFIQYLMYTEEWIKERATDLQLRINKESGA